MENVCALCRVNTDLQKSHIIPEFFYTMVYDLNPRRFRVISVDPSVPERFEQKGIRERLLCKACEGKLAKWEKYVKETFVDGNGVVATPIQDGFLLQGIDYKTFKLFLMSLIWRMSVSSLEFFKLVDLERKYEDALRTALLNEDPLQPDEFPCVFIRVKVAGKFIKDWISQPSLFTGISGERICCVVINGILYTFTIGRQPASSVASQAAINEKNSMIVLDGNAWDYPFLREDFIRQYGAIQARKNAKGD